MCQTQYHFHTSVEGPRGTLWKKNLFAALLESAHARLVELVSQLCQLGPDLTRRQNPVYMIDRDTPPGHFRKPRAFRTLYDGDAAFALDRLEAECAVGAAAGQNDADATIAMNGCQRAEQMVDRNLRRNC